MPRSTWLPGSSLRPSPLKCPQRGSQRAQVRAQGCRMGGGQGCDAETRVPPCPCPAPWELRTGQNLPGATASLRAPRGVHVAPTWLRRVTMASRGAPALLRVHPRSSVPSSSHEDPRASPVPGAVLPSGLVAHGDNPDGCPWPCAHPRHQQAQSSRASCSPPPGEGNPAQGTQDPWEGC